MSFNAIEQHVVVVITNYLFVIATYKFLGHLNLCASTIITALSFRPLVNNIVPTHFSSTFRPNFLILLRCKAIALCADRFWSVVLSAETNA